eukprot:sb/3476657/
MWTERDRKRQRWKQTDRDRRTDKHALTISLSVSVSVSLSLSLHLNLYPSYSVRLSQICVYLSLSLSDLSQYPSLFPSPTLSLLPSLFSLSASDPSDFASILCLYRFRTHAAIMRL